METLLMVEITEAEVVDDELCGVVFFSFGDNQPELYSKSCCLVVS
jgi:hypothetical protein